MLFDYQLQIMEDSNISLSEKKIFIPNLDNKGKKQTPLSKLKGFFKFRAIIKKSSSNTRIQTRIIFKTKYRM